MKTLKLLSLALLIPMVSGCVRVPAKAKPVEVTKFILVDASFANQKVLPNS